MEHEVSKGNRVHHLLPFQISSTYLQPSSPDTNSDTLKMSLLCSEALCISTSAEHRIQIRQKEKSGLGFGDIFSKLSVAELWVRHY